MMRMIVAASILLAATIFSSSAAIADGYGGGGYGGGGYGNGGYGGGCYDRCQDRCQHNYDRCRPSCDHGRRHCWPVYRYETRRVFSHYERDCYGCNRPVWRYIREKVYAGQKCASSCGGHRHHRGCGHDRGRYDNDAYRGGGEYSREDDAFPGYRGYDD
jgi:hypothetical protein